MVFLVFVVDVESEDGYICGQGYDDDGQVVVYIYKYIGKYR